MVDVLDCHRALLHARAARHAVPDDVVADGVRNERRHRERLVPEQLRALREQLVAEPHDQELRRELLARRIGRADVLATSALGARHRVDHLLPRHVGDRRGPEPHRALVLDGEIERLEPATRPRAAEPDVDGGGGDVEVLRAWKVDEEPDDEQNVRPHEEPLAYLGPGAGAEHLRDRVGEGRPARGPLVDPGRDQRGVPGEQREHDQRDQAEDEVCLTEVAAPETLRSLHLADPERGGDADEHEHHEEVDDQGEPPLRAQPRHGLALCHGGDQRHHDRREEHQEAPEDDRVDQPRDEPLEQFPLPEHDHRLVANPPRHVVEPLRRLAQPNEPREHERASAEQRPRDREHGDESECRQGRLHQVAGEATPRSSAAARQRRRAAPRAGRRRPRSRRPT